MSKRHKSLTFPGCLRCRGVRGARRLLIALEQLVHFALDVTGGHREPLAHAVAGGLKRTDGERMSAASLSSPAPADADVRRSAVISPVSGRGVRGLVLIQQHKRV